MAGYNYVFQKYNKENMARAAGLYLPISRKKSVEVASFLRGKPVERAKREIDEVINKKRAVPYTKFVQSIPHRRGDMTTGRYPVNTVIEIKKVLNSAISNAVEKGFDEKNLTICHISVQRGPTLWHYGRHHGRKRKIAHIEIVVESNVSETSKKDKKEIKKTVQSDVKQIKDLAVSEQSSNISPVSKQEKENNDLK